MIIDENGISHYGCIYGIKAINPINPIKTTNGFYVGQTINFKYRKIEHWSRGNKKDPNNQVIDKAIYKYGRNNFEMFIIEYCNSLDEMNNAEEEIITYFKSINAKLYNIKNGGNNHLLPQSVKDKISKAGTGRKVSDAQKKLM